MFTDLIKGKKPAKKTKKENPEISDERLDELMDRLFSKGELEEEFDIEEDEDEDEGEEMDKGDSYFARKAKKARKELLKGNDEDEDLDDTEDEMEKARMGEYGKSDAEAGLPPSKVGKTNKEYMTAYNTAKEKMSKGVSKEQRREMMSKVYSMVDDLSDQELEAFLQSRQVKKAMVMGVFNQMSNNELKDFVSSDAVNGFSKMESMDKGKHEMDKGQMMEEMDKGEDPNDPGQDIRNQLAEIEKNLSMYGFK